MATDYNIERHREWLGFLQPVGLVVSPYALVNAEAYVDQNISEPYQRFLACVIEKRNSLGEEVTAVPDLGHLLQTVMEWRDGDLKSETDAKVLINSLSVPLPEYGEVLSPSFVVEEADPEKKVTSPILLLVQEIGCGLSFDEPLSDDKYKWIASPQARLERLLREREIPIGLIFNQTEIRLVYAPRGESSGHITFPVKVMAEPSGRRVFGALYMLLSEGRLFSLPSAKRLPSILAESRKYQNVVSNKLAEQVLDSLYELVRGFQSADDFTKGNLLGYTLREDPHHIYAGLLTTILRLVFTLYAEDRGLTPNEEVYINHYSISGLYERLRADAALYPDTMYQRYGAWAQLLSLFRVIHDGASHGSFVLPSRHGRLFDPDAYSFLEGRPYMVNRVMTKRIDPPMVPDGVIYHVLEKLLVVDGERISYRTLDVEQIGSVYETMMGFSIEVALGRSIAIKAKKSRGAPVSINLDDLLAEPGKSRIKWLKDKTEQDFSGKAAQAIEIANSIDTLVPALSSKVSHRTPAVIPMGAMTLQPSDERRRSGSHYTPRTLTEPIVRTTLGPIFEQLGATPKPEQILELKVCDPAMGSGAFLVEACRQLSEKLVESWHYHNCTPQIPPDEDELLHARRIIAQRCIYGVDKNPVAVDLAKLSLWLATLAKDHPFTFLDHSLKCGDSLVGLSLKSIQCFHWNENEKTILPVEKFVRDRVAEATELRARIEKASDSTPDQELKQLLREADEAIQDIQLVGDVVIGTFLSEGSETNREAHRVASAAEALRFLSKEIARSEFLAFKAELFEPFGTLIPFHWQIEYPEVFLGKNSGFDCFVGNPPFAGKNTLLNSYPANFLDWLKFVHPGSHGNSDVVAHFFRRAFILLRQGGSFGLIATNTIAQGDTRETGLKWIRSNGGTIYEARRRLKWPGMAAVIVSVAHIIKRLTVPSARLDGKAVPYISSYLVVSDSDHAPAVLKENANKSFQGSILLGMGFTFDDSDPESIASPIAEMKRLIAKDSKNAERIFPYIGGEEVNNSPTHKAHRFAIDFFDRTLEESEQWPDLLNIVRTKVKPERDGQKRDALRKRWWQYAEKRPGLYSTIRDMSRVLVSCRHQPNWAATFMTSSCVFAESLVVFAIDSSAGLAVVQSRCHELWARFFGSSMKDDLRYTPSDCFETFPFPLEFEKSAQLEQVGKRYYDFRSKYMVANDEGLTATYNRFHDPDENSTEIHKLRNLHDEMDRAVLNAYGWADIKPNPTFVLDYDDEEEDSDNSGNNRKNRKPWRHRWSDEIQDEVLSRLLALNKQRVKDEHDAEVVTSSTGSGHSNKKNKSKKKEIETNPRQQGLF